MATEAPRLDDYSRESILQCDTGRLKMHISKLAVEFAALGEVEASSRLISHYNNFDGYHDDHLKHFDKLWNLWDMIQSWPDGEEERVRDRIESDRKSKQSSTEENGRAAKQAKVDVSDKPITRHNVTAKVDEVAREDALRWQWLLDSEALSPAVDKGASPQGQDLAPVDLQEVVKHMINKFEGKERLEASNKDSKTTDALLLQPIVYGDRWSSVLANALDLRLLLDETPGADFGGRGSAPSSEKILDFIAQRLNDDEQLPHLLESKRAWRMLKDGALAKAAKIDQERLKSFVKQFEDAVVERIEHGKPRLEPMSLKETLDTMEHNSKHNPQLFEDEWEIPENLFASPATEAEIADTERRLEIELPEDYKEFVRITNGFGAAFSGIIFEPPLYPLKDLRWFRDDEDYFTDLLLEMPADFFSVACVQSADWPTVGKAIEIGTEDTYNIWLIPASKMNELKDKVFTILNNEKYTHSMVVKKNLRNFINDFSGSVEEFKKTDWGCIRWASGGAASMDSFPSFRAYLRNVAEEGKRLDYDFKSHGKFIGYAFQNAVSE